MDQKILYSRKQKHVLLFRKSDFLFFKVSNTNNMPIFYLGKKLFCLSLDLLDIKATWKTHDVFVK
jgi:hypothetical protein